VPLNNRQSVNLDGGELEQGVELKPVQPAPSRPAVQKVPQAKHHLFGLIVSIVPSSNQPCGRANHSTYTLNAQIKGKKKGDMHLVNFKNEHSGNQLRCHSAEPGPRQQSGKGRQGLYQGGVALHLYLENAEKFLALQHLQRCLPHLRERKVLVRLSLVEVTHTPKTYP